MDNEHDDTTIIDHAKIAALEAEIEELLKERPEFVPFQKEVKRRLKAAGSFENKMKVIEFMAQEQALALSTVCTRAVEVTTKVAKLL